MTTPAHNTPTTTPVQISAVGTRGKKLGNWTNANSFEVRTRRGSVVLDLRSPQIQGDIEIKVDMDHSTLKLLVPQDAAIDQWDLHWQGRGKVKQTFHEKTDSTRTIRITGEIRHGEVRVTSGGIAQLSAMFTKQYLKDVRRAGRERDFPTVDDPTRTA
jgi:hypothetical protein